MSTATTSLLETLASYVPHLIVRYVAANPQPLSEPQQERFPAAVLVADISGFTRLTERLARRGPQGVEDLSSLLNAYFGQLIDVVIDHDGDIVEFTGDGIIALWPATEDAPLNSAVLRAADCGLAVQQAMSLYEQGDQSSLSLRVCVCAGEVLFASVGGVLNRWELLVAGQHVFQQVSSTEKQTRPGQVLLSPEAWALVGQQCSGQVSESGAVRLESVPADVPRLPQPPVDLQPAMIGPMRGYLPGAILDRLEAGLSDWLAELRFLTVLFVCLDGIDYDGPEMLEQTHTVMRGLQVALYRYEGSVNQFIVDDKGTIFVAALGLPPLTHEDDAVRGVQAALAMHEQMQTLGIACTIGVTTGWVFCGARGSVRRRDYAMIGDAMNLAARLMQCAGEIIPPESIPILCDNITYEATRNRLAFEALPPVSVKGKNEPVPVYRPLGRELTTVRRRTAMVGRQAERALLAEHVQRLRQGETSIVIIEGETGMGKSRLLGDLQQQVETLDVTCLVGLGDAVEQASSYHAWRPIVRQLFHLDALPDDPARRRSHVIERLLFDMEASRLLPLLNAVLPLDIPDNEITTQMAGQVRADNTRRLLVRILQLSASLTPLLVVLDEAHWLDSASWALALDVAQQVRPLLLVVAMRPPNQPFATEYSQLLHHTGTHHIILGSLSHEETLQVICQALGVQSLPDQVASFILQKSEGNPFFSEELVYALRDAGLITVANGQCTLQPGADDLNSLDFPASLQGIVISRIDRLLPSQQLVLKVASVIGQIFALRTLMAIHPIEEDKPLLPDYLQSLESLDITKLAAAEPYLTYIFKHVTIHEVVYNLLLFAQRRALHRAVAQWYEETYTDDLSPHYPLLAYHWQKAEVVPRAIDYLEKAGEQALYAYANREAVRFFREILAMVDRQQQPEPPYGEQAQQEAASSDAEEDADLFDPVPFVSPSVLRRARWERQLGEAYLALGQLPESRQHLERAVALLKRPVPTRRRKLTTTTLRQIVRQTAHRLLASRVRQHSPEERAAIMEIARAYEALMTIYFFANETLAAIYTSLMTLNLAEQAGSAAHMARAYANMCIATGSLAIHPLAESYGRQAVETAQHVDELTTQEYVMNIVGLYRVGVGQWSEARLVLEQSVDMSDQLGDRHRWGTAWTLLSQLAYYEGDFARSAEMFSQLFSEAQRSGDVLQQAWARGGQGETSLRLGRLDEACVFLKDANRLLAENAELPSQISNYGLLAMAHLRQGDQQRALEAAQAAVRLLANIPVPTAYYLIEGYAGFAETYLALWQASGGQSPEQRRILARQARQACDALAHFARTFPIGRPRSLLWQGLYAWLAGNPARAHQTWRKGLSVAQQMAMPYEEALLQYEIGRHISGAQRLAHLQSAHTLFCRLGAALDCARVEKLLAAAQPPPA